jgi:hypothetical protein
VLFPTYRQIKSLTDDQLREHFDEANEKDQAMYCNFYLDGLRRRESGRRERNMLVLTGVITVLTVANVVAVIYSVAN